MKYSNAWEALMDGSPGVVFAAAMLFVTAVLFWLARRARRAIPPAKGHPTAYDIRDRVERENATHDYEVQAEIERARHNEFQRFAQLEAARRAVVVEALVEPFPAVDVPRPRRGTRPYAKLHLRHAEKAEAA